MGAHIENTTHTHSLVFKQVTSPSKGEYVDVSIPRLNTAISD